MGTFKKPKFCCLHSPKFQKVDNVLVRNEVTGAVWSFPCGKRLGKSVGDGALERVLPAERVGMKAHMSRERRVVVSQRHGIDCMNRLVIEKGPF